jgi:hypothetical protein
MKRDPVVADEGGADRAHRGRYRFRRAANVEYGQQCRDLPGTSTISASQCRDSRAFLLATVDVQHDSPGDLLAQEVDHGWSVPGGFIKARLHRGLIRARRAAIGPTLFAAPASYGRASRRGGGLFEIRFLSADMIAATLQPV